MRVQRSGNVLLRVSGKTLQRITEQGAQVLAPALDSEHFPTAPLALNFDGSTAWFADGRGKASRLCLADGSIERFSWKLIDAAYEAPGRLVGFRPKGKRMQLVRFSDADPENLDVVALPEAKDLQWPFAPPTARWSEKWTSYEQACVTRSPHGVAATHAAGFLWIRWADNTETLWRIPTVSQGWLAAYVCDGGVVVTAVHNGRQGEIVWFDRSGFWVDAHRGRTMGPCVPTRDGFVAWIDEELCRFEGQPLRPTKSVHVGGRLAHLNIDEHGVAVAATEEPGVGVFVADAGGVATFGDPGYEDAQTPYKRIAEPEHHEALRFVWEQDPVLGSIPVPDETQVQRLLALAEKAPVDVEALARILPWKPQRLAQESGAAVWVLNSLLRVPLPELDAPAVLRILHRLAAGGQRPFVDHALRQALPSRWRDLSVREPIEDWFRNHAHLAHRFAPVLSGVAGATAVRGAALVAEPGNGPIYWCLRVQSEGPMVEVVIHGFDAKCLAQVPQDANEPFVFRGHLRRPDGTTQPGFVTVMLHEQGWYSVEFNGKPEADGQKARVLTGAGFEGIDLAAAPNETLALRSLTNHGSKYLRRGLRRGRPVVDVVGVSVREFDQPKPIRSRRWNALGEFFARLCASELLELSGELGPEATKAVEALLFEHAYDLDVAAERIVDCIVEMDEVEELYGGPEDVRAVLEALIVS